MERKSNGNNKAKGNHGLGSAVGSLDSSKQQECIIISRTVNTAFSL